MHTVCDRDQIYEFEPRSTVLLCIDFQRDFLAQVGFGATQGAPVDSLRKVIPPSGKVLATARQAGVTVMHTRECYAPDLSDLNSFRRARDRVIGAQGPLGRFLIRGEPGTEIVPELAPLATERIIDKPGFNAFYKTPLENELRSIDVSHLILMGVTTQVCIASTLRGAVDHGFFPLVLSDCCASWDPLDHEATLRVIFSENHQFGWVSDSRRLLESFAG
jgi:biuret amidohydrolase